MAQWAQSTLPAGIPGSIPVPDTPCSPSTEMEHQGVYPSETNQEKKNPQSNQSLDLHIAYMC